MMIRFVFNKFLAKLSMELIDNIASTIDHISMYIFDHHDVHDALREQIR